MEFQFSEQKLTERNYISTKVILIFLPPNKLRKIVQYYAKKQHYKCTLFIFVEHYFLKMNDRN